MGTGAPRSFGTELWGKRYAIVYLALLIRFVIEIARWSQPHTGLSSLICFGDQFAARRVPALSEVPLYTYPLSGYDGQFYAQLAVTGDPFAPDLKNALDGPSYRGRRILLPALAHLAGLGRPAWIIQAYALANLLCFVVLAALLARWWFPPTDLHNLLRWVGTLFGSGTLVSVTRSLTDTPALLVIALGGRLVEKNRHLIGAAVLAVAGLVRETSVLCAAAFAPTTEPERRTWPRAALAALLCLAPISIWAAVLNLRYGGGVGTRNFDLPFVSLARKLAEICRLARVHGFDLQTRIEIFEVVALGTQAGFLLLRPRIHLVWWRIGAAFSVLWIFLGWAVWEAAPSAAARAVLPLTLAFNLLAPRNRRGLALLVVGNLTVLSAVAIVRAAPREQTIFGHGVTCRYPPPWQPQEHLGRRSWRWASGSASLTLDNPTSGALPATLDFEIASVTPRSVTLRAASDAGAGARSISLPAQKRIPVRYGPFLLPPGDSEIAFTTTDPPWREPAGNKRPLAFSIQNLYLTIDSTRR
jgi:hypothetical protein